MSASNFDFLRRRLPELHALGQQAERYFHQDPNTCLLKLRQFGEVLTHDLAERAGLQPRPDDSQFERIGLLQRSQFVPYEISDLLHKVRIVGNEANHAQSGDHRSALATLKLCWQLALWHHRTHFEPGHRSGPFIPPSPANATPLADASVQAELVRLQERVRSHQQRESAARAALLSTRQESELRLRTKAQALESARMDNERLQAELATLQKTLASTATRTEAQQRAAPEPSTTASHGSDEAESPQIELDEFEARALIDVQLREAGWRADSMQLTHALGARPQAGVNQAIANWPLHGQGISIASTESPSPQAADYVLFMGLTPVGLIEALPAQTLLAGGLPLAEAKAAALRAQWRDSASQGGSHHLAPEASHHSLRLAYVANGRPWASWLPAQSGIWFHDGRLPHQLPHDLAGFHRPEELAAMGVLDDPAHASALSDLHSPAWRCLQLQPHQHSAVEAATAALTGGQRRVLLSMAAGTGKHRTAAVLVLQLLASRHVARVLWLDHDSADQPPAPQTFRQAPALCEALDLPLEAAALLPASAWELTLSSTRRMAEVLRRDEAGQWGVGRFDLVLALDSLPPGLTAGPCAHARPSEPASQAPPSLQTQLLDASSVIGHFDCPAVGLASAPTAHMRHPFGAPVFDYGVSEAVVDGMRRDHTPPVAVHTNLSVAGVWLPAGTAVAMLPVHGEATPPQGLPRAMGFEVEDFNRRVIVPAHTRALCEALATEIDPAHPSKTLVCCVDPAHASRVAIALREAFARRHPQLPHQAVAHIDEGLPQADALWQAFSRQPLPGVAVSAHALALLPALPCVGTLVMLRREDSALWLDQWLSRAAAPPASGAAKPFRVFDGARVFEPVMRWHDQPAPAESVAAAPAVRPPAPEPLEAGKRKRRKTAARAQAASAPPAHVATAAAEAPASVTALVAELLRLDDDFARERLRPHLVQGLQGLNTLAHPVTRAVVQEAAGTSFDALPHLMHKLPVSELAGWWMRRPGLAELLSGLRTPTQAACAQPVCADPDHLLELSPCWGDMAAPGHWQPQTPVGGPRALLQGLQDWARHWQAKEAAIQPDSAQAANDAATRAVRALRCLCNAPATLNWADMRALAIALHAAGFGEVRLACAWEALHGERIWPRHAGWLRHLLLGEPLVDHATRVSNAMARLPKALHQKVNAARSEALEALAEQTRHLLVPDWRQWARPRAHETQEMAFNRVNALFDGQAHQCVHALQSELWK